MRCSKCDAYLESENQDCPSCAGKANSTSSQATETGASIGKAVCLVLAIFGVVGMIVLITVFNSVVGLLKSV
jgi:hypothetical protein